MDLSIIILNYKSRGLTKQCLKGILKSKPQLNYEIIIVDNNSNDGCIKYIKKDIKENPHVSYIQSDRNKGMGAGNNLGIKKAKGKYILILNPDVAIFKDSLDKMHKYLESHPEIAVLGPKLTTPAKELQYSCFRFPTPFDFIIRRINLPFGKKALSNYQMQAWDHNNIKEVDWVQGSCMMLRKEIINKVGMFDERYSMYLEDTDWCRRFWSNGYKVIYFPEVSLIHYYSRGAAGSGLFKSLFKKITWIHIASAVKYFLKWRKKTITTLSQNLSRIES